MIKLHPFVSIFSESTRSWSLVTLHIKVVPHLCSKHRLWMLLRMRTRAVQRLLIKWVPKQSKIVTHIIQILLTAELTEKGVNS